LNKTFKKGMIIDGNESVLGRLASRVSKIALEGEEVIIVNADNIYITGNKNAIIKKYMEKIEIGTVSKGPFVQKTVDGIVKSSIRGMIGRNKQRGIDALKRIKVFSGVPAEYKDKPMVSMEKINKEKPIKKISVSELSKLLGGQ